MSKFAPTKHYESALRKIEDFIFEPTQDTRLVERFLDEHDAALEFIAENPGTPAIHPETGDRSWSFSNGRYRIFYIPTPDTIHLVDIIDNRQLNANVYPGNSLPTFGVDD